MSTTPEQTKHVKVKRSIISFKTFRRVIFNLIAVVLFLLVFILSPWGTQALISVANSSLEELHVDYDEGGLLSELHLSSITWQQVSTQAKISDFTFSLDLSCIWKLAVCVELVEAKKIDVSITPSQDTTEPEATANTVITLPVSVSIQRAYFGKTVVTVKDQLDLSWQSLSTSLEFFQVLNLAQLTIQNLHVTTYAAQQAPVASSTSNQAAPFDFSSLQYQGVESVPIQLPIHFNIDKLALPNFQLDLADQSPLGFKTIQLALTGNAEQIKLNKLFVSHEMGQLNADATIHLGGDLQHTFNLDAQGELANNQQMVIKMQSAGNLQGLETEVAVSGPFTFDSKINVQPSNSKLPLELRVNWQDARWPLDAPTIESPKGDLALVGDLEELLLTMTTQVSGQDIPSSHVNLAGAASLFDANKQVSISELLIETLDGRVLNSGTLLLTDSLDWRGNTTLENINIGLLLPKHPAELNGQVVVHAANVDGIWQASVDKFDVYGSYLDYPLKALGKVAYHQNDGANLEQLVLTNGANKLQLVGQLDAQQNMDFKFSLDAPKLTQTVPDLSGAMKASGQLSGSINAPQVSYNVNGQSLAFSDVSIEQMMGKGTLRWDQVKPMDVDINLAGVQVANKYLNNASFSLRGNAAAHDIKVTSEGEIANVDIYLQGQLEDTAWHGRWLNGDIKTEYVQLTLVDAFDISADWANQSYLVGAHCWNERNSKLCIKQAQFKQQKADWDISLTDFDWSSVVQKLDLPDLKIQTSSLLSLETKGRWSPDLAPIIDVSASLSAADWTVQTKESVKLSLREIQLSAKADAQKLSTHLALSGEHIGDIAFNLVTDSELLQQDFSHDIQGKLLLTGLDIAPFKKILPQLERLQGVLKGETDIAGTVNKPLLYGNIGLSNAAVKGEGLPISLSEMTQAITLNGDNADFKGSYKFGNGYGKLAGNISWLPVLKGQLSITGDALEVDYQSMIKAHISPNLNIKFAPGGVAVTGEVVVPYARVKVRDLPPGSVSPSGDVILVEQQKLAEQQQQEFLLDVLVKIDPAKKSEVKLDAYGLTSDLQGQLRIEQKAKGMFGNGELRLVNGRYRGNGQNLVIREGNISFNGTLDRPYLNIEAIRDPLLTEDGVIAGLKVQGPAEQPKVSIFSEPDMEQQQSLSYMLTGRGIGESSDDSQDTVITNTLLAIGLGQSENIVSKVGNKLGFEDVAFDTSGQGDHTQLSLTGTIAPGLQLRYGVGVFDSVSEVAIRYELIPRLYLEAISGLSNAVDFYYQFSIEGSQNEKVKDEQ